MLGFELDAYGYPGTYRFNYKCWTEGSLWLLKQALIRSGNVVVDKTDTADAIDAVEGGFDKIKELKIDNICALSFDFDLYVSGDFSFFMQFRRNKNSWVTRNELIRKIGRGAYDMGSNVAIAMCEAIEGFATQSLAAGDPRSSPNRQLDLRIWL
jgi:hypothetical protein